MGYGCLRLHVVRTEPEELESITDERLKFRERMRILLWPVKES